MIRGFFDPLGSPQPLVTVAIRLPRLAVDATWQTVTFVIDTGATHTVIHPRDAESRLGLRLDRPTTTSPRSYRSIQGVGGHSRIYEEDGFMGFRSEDGRWHAIPATVGLAERTLNNTDLPSILGWDVLQNFRLTVSRRPQLVTLEWVLPPP